MIRKVGLYLYRGIIFIALSFMLVLILNHIMDESFQLLYFDIKSGFCDNKKYLCFLCGIFLVLCGVMILWVRGSKRGLVLRWTIRIGKREMVSLFSADKVNYLVFMVSVLVSVIGLVYVYRETGNEMVSDWGRDKTVAHSFGGIDGNAYTGTLEAFETNYAAGHRTFEVDLAVTSDGIVVLRHDWEQKIQEADFSEENIPTAEEFLSVPILGKYTPLLFEDLCELMNEYPDIWIVLDSKIGDTEEIKAQYEFFVKTVERLGTQEILDRLIIQLYNEEMYEVVHQVYPFKQYIFTLYRRWDESLDEFVELCRWSATHNVDVITMWGYLASDEVLEVAQRYGIDVYVHTVNDIDEAQDFLERGVKGIYTDFIIPSELEEE